jgi:hypothetical protein
MSLSISGMSGSAGMVNAMSGASTGLPPQQKMSLLFDKIDSGGSGTITQSQFSGAFQALNPPAVFQQKGAGAIFSALDPSGSGTISKADFVSGMSQLMASLRGDGGASSAPAPASAQSLTSSIQFLNSIDPNSLPSNARPGSLINTSA